MKIIRRTSEIKRDSPGLRSISRFVERDIVVFGMQIPRKPFVDWSWSLIISGQSCRSHGTAHVGVSH